MLNQKANNEEKISYRVECLQAGTTHPVLGAIPNAGCFPIPIQGTGTIITDNSDTTTYGVGKLVTGTGTLFTQDGFASGGGASVSKVQPGDYIASSVSGAIIRRVMLVLDDTHLVLEAKFPSSYSGNLYIVRRAFYKMIYAKSVGSATAKLQEVDFLVNETFLNGGSPVSYDCSTSGAQIMFQLDE